MYVNNRKCEKMKSFNDIVNDQNQQQTVTISATITTSRQTNNKCHCDSDSIFVYLNHKSTLVDDNNHDDYDLSDFYSIYLSTQ